jgi:hypothetical protein
MPTYVSLVNWTEQGIKNFRDTHRRAEDVRGIIEKNGGKLRQLSGRLANTTWSRWPTSLTTRPLPPSCYRLAPAATSGPPPGWPRVLRTPPRNGQEPADLSAATTPTFLALEPPATKLMAGRSPRRSASRVALASPPGHRFDPGSSTW